MDTPIVILGFAHVRINEMQFRADQYKIRLRDYARAINLHYAKTQGTNAPCTKVPFMGEKLGEYYANR